MTMTTDQLEGLAGTGKVLTDGGEKVGSIGQIYLDDSSGAPAWVTVKTGLFGTAESFVPVQGARVNGSDLVVGYDKATIKAAPRVDPDGHLSPAEEQDLYRHYGLATAGPVDTADRSGGPVDTSSWDGVGDVPSDLDDPSEAADNRPDLAGRPGIVGRDRSGPTTDDAMTRSEERVRIGTQTREAGRARLRKHIVTENVTQTVPVTREEARVVREPITDANWAKATDGPEITEQVHEVTLHDEVPVVQKDVVPVERVRLDTETVTEQVQVSEQVRKEQIEVEGPNTAPRR